MKTSGDLGLRPRFHGATGGVLGGAFHGVVLFHGLSIGSRAGIGGLPQSLTWALGSANAGNINVEIVLPAPIVTVLEGGGGPLKSGGGSEGIARNVRPQSAALLLLASST